MNPVAPHHSPTSVGLSHLDTAVVKAKLGQAKSLEYKDDKAALAMYAALAKEGIPEAQFRYSQMLLEGRGAPRHFSKAFGYLQVAASKGHPEAQLTLPSVFKRMNCLLNIARDFDELTKPDGLSIPLKLQERILPVLMIGKKERLIVENETITQNDFITALDDLNNVLANMDKHFFADADNFFAEMDCCAKTVPQKYRQGDPAMLLADGLSNFNQQKKTTIVIVSEEGWLPDEVWNHVGDYISVSENINLITTSKAHSQMSKEDKPWQERLIRQRIQTILDSIIPSNLRNILEDSWIQNCIVKGVITFEQLNDIDIVDNNYCSGLSGSLCDPDVQNWLDQHPEYIKKVFALSHDAGLALLGPEVRNSIDKKTLTFEQLNRLKVYDQYEDFFTWLDLHPHYVDEVVALPEPGIRLLGSAWVRGHIDNKNLTFAALIKVPKQYDYLAQDVMDWLDQHAQYIEAVISQRCNFDGLRNAQLRDRIDNQSFTSKQFLDFASADYNWTIHNWLNQHPQYVDQGCVLSKYAFRALYSGCVRNGIDNRHFTFEELNGISKAASMVFNMCENFEKKLHMSWRGKETETHLVDELGYEDWLEQYPQHVAKIIRLSDLAAKALIFNNYLKTHIDNETISFAELNGITKGGWKVLGASHTAPVQQWLAQHPQFLGQVLVLSYWGGYALKNFAWIRDRIANDTLTFVQLNGIGESGACALCELEADEKNMKKFQDWLCLNPDYMRLFFCSSKWGGFVLRSSWVRDYIEDETLTLADIDGVTEGGVHAFCEEEGGENNEESIQKWLYQNPTYIVPVFGLSTWAAKALRDRVQIRNCIDNGTLTFAQLNGITEKKYQLLISDEINAQIEENPQKLVQFILSRAAYLGG